VIIGLLFVPALSDYTGWRIVFTISVILSLVA
jgi:MFS family permease